MNRKRFAQAVRKNRFYQLLGLKNGFMILAPRLSFFKFLTGSKLFNRSAVLRRNHHR